MLSIHWRILGANTAIAPIRSVNGSCPRPAGKEFCMADGQRAICSTGRAKKVAPKIFANFLTTLHANYPFNSLLTWKVLLSVFSIDDAK